MEKIRRKEKRSDEIEFREFRNDKTRKDGGEEMRRAWKKRWIPTCPSCWLTGYGLFFFFLASPTWSRQGESVSAGPQAWRWPAMTAGEAQRRSPEEPQPGGGVGAAADTNTPHSPLNNSAPHLWRASGKAAPCRRTDNTAALRRGTKATETCVASRENMPPIPKKESFRAKKKASIMSLTNRSDAPPADISVEGPNMTFTLSPGTQIYFVIHTADTTSWKWRQ